ncbi:MAG: carboxypeptidase regulatory-like domain-containing protein [Bacteroidota bacterium]
MNRLIAFLFGLLCCCQVQGQTVLEGKITDRETGEDLIGATIQLYQDGLFQQGSVSDFNGNYSLQVEPGTYELSINHIGHTPRQIAELVITSGRVNRLDISMETSVYTTDVVEVTYYRKPLIEVDKTRGGIVLTAKEIQAAATRDVNALISMAPGATQIDENDEVSIKGGRFSGTDYYIDDFRVTGNVFIPVSEIEQLEVITGGIDAKYGDATGGIVSIITKGPAGQFSGGLEMETSSGLDDYGRNLLSFYLSGPLVKKDSTTSLLGFRLAGRYLSLLDDDPAATDVYRIKNNSLSELMANPITRVGVSRLPSAEYISDEDVEHLGYRPDEQSKQMDLMARLDARLSKQIDLMLTGSYSTLRDQFTPNDDRLDVPSWRLLNTHNNPTGHTQKYRANMRFRHRLGAQDLNDEEKAYSPIRNAYYVFQVGYEKNLFDVADHRHGDRAFDYGHIGRFDYEWIPSLDIVEGGTGVAHVDYQQVFQGYTPGRSNPVLANYNLASNVEDINDYSTLNGQFIGAVDAAWNFHSNVGRVYNRIGKRDSDLMSANIHGAFELTPRDSDKGRHHISFGLTYEQRVERGYEVRPNALWNIARQQANRHIIGLDSTRVIDALIGLGNDPDTVLIYDTRIIDLEDRLFYRNVRDVAFPGMEREEALHQYVNVDGLSPDQLSLDMFSAQELTDQDLIEYWGFDYLGNKLGSDVKFDDFFTARDENGVRSFPVAANTPAYTAMYVQDKFSFRNIIFRLGLRVDRYDANTKVLRDPYSLYDIMEADEFYAATGQEQPGGVADDYKVYVDGGNSDAVKAFRKGDQWFFPNGTPANDGNIIFGGEVVTPRYVNPDADIKSADFNPSESFEDYEPQLNWMPRLAFSFPISDAANFFAHYDILTQRPTSNTRATALDYFYFNERTPENNPNLKPSKTIEYELGFQQKLTERSALKMTAHYREMRDMIQLRTYLYVPAPVNQYTTFDNLDFGTVKGFSLQYDLRRTQNIKVNANYTLQFASGTGSEAESQRGLTNRGNIRTLYPLDFDVRHRVMGSIDYRYDKGSKYNGPRFMGKDILANAGIYLQAIAFSGIPYTAKLQAQRLNGAGTVGALNGARIPWSFTLNLRADKTFSLSWREDQALNLNVYIRVQNVLDRRNVVQVYPATGSPSDDGYLASANGQSEIDEIVNSGRSLAAFLQSYQWRLNNPDFFSLPRRIVLGAIMDF